MRQPIIALQVATVCLALAAAAHGDLFYSYDSNTDELVTIDSATGQVTASGNTVGIPAGHRVADLAILDNGELWASVTEDNGSPPIAAAHLAQIDTTTGAIILPLIPIMINNEQADFAEGLMADGNQLIATIGVPDVSPPFNSNHLVRLGFDGVVTEVIAAYTDPECAVTTDCECDTLAPDRQDVAIGIGVDAMQSYLDDPRYEFVRADTSRTVIAVWRFSEHPEIIVRGLDWVGDQIIFLAVLVSDTSIQTFYFLDPDTGDFTPGVQLAVAGSYRDYVPAFETCPWDCDGSNDGQVGIADFLAVLAQWGASGTSCHFAGGATVGIDEFLDLLANWGACS